jgi:hypothetical protein
MHRVAATARIALRGHARRKNGNLEIAGTSSEVRFHVVCLLGNRCSTLFGYVDLIVL